MYGYDEGLPQSGRRTQSADRNKSKSDTNPPKSSVNGNTIYNAFENEVGYSSGRASGDERDGLINSSRSNIPTKKGKIMSATNSKREVAKKKKNELTAPASSGFKRDAMDQPPSVELMAKFAAEKERSLFFCRYFISFFPHSHLHIFIACSY